MVYRIFVLAFAVTLVAAVGCSGEGPGSTTIAITNRITTLQAGETHTFDIAVENDQGAGFTISLNGPGTAVPAGQSVLYLAPPTPPSPDSVTLTVTAANGSGASDSNTFTITAASGPVVTISPATFGATAGDPAVVLNIAVTQDAPSNVLMVGVSGSPTCNGPCGSFGAVSGAPGGGAYTVQYFPPAAVTKMTQQQVAALSNLSGATQGLAFVTIRPSRRALP